MSHNTFGHLFRVTTFGESHGPALGCVVDGCPSRIPLEAAEIQQWLDLRRPGQSRFTTQRQEADAVKILSGVMTGEDGVQRTTGTPIALMIENTDQRSKDYGEIKDSYRPGHADYVYDVKYGFRDYRGGGRSSARETAARVAAGAVARKVIPEVKIRAALIQVGPKKIDRVALGLGRGLAQPAVLPRPPRGARMGRLSRQHPQSRLLHRRGAGGGGRGRAARLGRAGLWQARHRYRGGADVDQCGQGRGDRRRFRLRRTHRRGKRRRNARRQ